MHIPSFLWLSLHTTMVRATSVSWVIWISSTASSSWFWSPVARYSELLDAENIGITLPGSCFHCFFSNDVDQSPIFWEIFGHLCPAQA